MSEPPSASSSPFKIKLKPKQTAYKVYKVSFSFTPLRNHLALFVEIDNATSSGYLFHVIGDINKGMTYECIDQDKPHLSPTYLGQEFIGVVLFGSIVRVIETCERIPTPKRQLDDLGRKVYPEEPFRRCAEWVEDAVQALKDNGILLMSCEKLLDQGLASKAQNDQKEGKGTFVLDSDKLVSMELPSATDGIQEWLSRVR